MKKFAVLILTLFLIGGLTLPGVASSISENNNLGPYVELFIGDGSVREPLIETDFGWLLPAVQFASDLGFLQLNMSIKSDPVIAWGLTATNLAAVPVNFGFAVFVPVVMPGLPTLVSASVVGGMTDFTGNGVAINPTNASGFLQDNTINPPGFMWSVGNAVVNPAGSAGAIYPYGPAGPFTMAGPGPVVGAAIFGETVSFTLTGFGDIASLTGYCSIVPIPVPGAVWLLGSGILALIGISRRSRS